MSKEERTPEETPELNKNTNASTNQRLLEATKGGFETFKAALSTADVTAKSFVKSLDSLIDYVKQSDESAKKIVNAMIDSVQAELKLGSASEERRDTLNRQLFTLFEKVAEEKEKDRNFILKAMGMVGSVLLIPLAIIFGAKKAGGK